LFAGNSGSNEKRQPGRRPVPSDSPILDVSVNRLRPLPATDFNYPIFVFSPTDPAPQVFQEERHRPASNLSPAAEGRACDVAPQSGRGHQPGGFPSAACPIHFAPIAVQNTAPVQSVPQPLAGARPGRAGATASASSGPTNDPGPATSWSPRIAPRTSAAAADAKGRPIKPESRNVDPESRFFRRRAAPAASSPRLGKSVEQPEAQLPAPGGPAPKLTVRTVGPTTCRRRRVAAQTNQKSKLSSWARPKGAPAGSGRLRRRCAGSRRV